jgi:hypothetical protein
MISLITEGYAETGIAQENASRAQADWWCCGDFHGYYLPATLSDGPGRAP